MVKENLTSGDEVEIDEEDSSVTRPEELVKKLFHRAGLKIISELKQQKMPKGLYPVKMFVLQSNSWIKALAQKKGTSKIISKSISWMPMESECLMEKDNLICQRILLKKKNFFQK